MRHNGSAGSVRRDLNDVPATADTGRVKESFTMVEETEDLLDRVLEIGGVEATETAALVRGRPRAGAAAEFERVAGSLRDRGYSAALWQDGPDTAAVVLQPAEAQAIRRVRPLVHWALLAATLATTTWAGAAHVGVNLLAEPARWTAGLPYALSLLLILGIHEMGHYVYARIRGVHVSPPYFIPAPFFLGTFGAFIRMDGEIRSRNDFFDIAVAGPLAGLVAAMIAVIGGIALASGPLLGHGMQPASSFLFAVLYQLAGGGDPGVAVALSPVVFAGWLGLLVTALNLVPVGQLDGGHIGYALWGRERSRLVGAGVIGVMVALGVFYSSHWLTWALLVWFIAGTAHPPARNELMPLTARRRLLGYAMFALFLLIVLPWPT